MKVCIFSQMTYIYNKFQINFRINVFKYAKKS